MLPCYLNVIRMYWKAKNLFAHSLWHMREFESLGKDSSPWNCSS